MNPPAKKALGRSIGDTVLAGLALLLIKYFGPEPIVPQRTSSSVSERVEHMHANMMKMFDLMDDAAIRRTKVMRNWMLLCTLAILLGLVAVGYIAQRNNYNATPAPINFNAMPPPIETPVVLFTRSGHWHKAVRDSLGVDRNYETWERINNAIGWMKP